MTEEGFICPYCRVQFPTSAKLQTHFVEMHSHSLSSADDVGEELQHTAATAGYRQLGEDVRINLVISVRCDLSSYCRFYPLCLYYSHALKESCYSQITYYLPSLCAAVFVIDCWIGIRDKIGSHSSYGHNNEEFRDNLQTCTFVCSSKIVIYCL